MPCLHRRGLKHFWVSCTLPYFLPSPQHHLSHGETGPTVGTKGRCAPEALPMACCPSEVPCESFPAPSSPPHSYQPQSQVHHECQVALATTTPKVSQIRERACWDHSRGTRGQYSPGHLTHWHHSLGAPPTPPSGALSSSSSPTGSKGRVSAGREGKGRGSGPPGAPLLSPARQRERELVECAQRNETGLTGVV